MLLADTHVHLLAGLDDGPRTADEAAAMARMLVAEGATAATALAHQNPAYPDNVAARLRAAAAALAADLKARGVPLAVYPTGEVMLTPDLVERFDAGELLTVADRGRFLLVEQPHGAFVDLRPFAAELGRRGVRVVVAHAERYPELLHDPGLAAAWIAAGCLIQVTASALADPRDGETERALRRWVRGGYVHLLGSDGHGIDRRRPRLRGGYDRVAKWAGPAAAERIGGVWASNLFAGLPVNPPPPGSQARSWWGRLFGA